MKKRRLNLRSAVDLTASVTMIAAAAALIWRAAATPPTFVSSVTRGQAGAPRYLPSRSTFRVSMSSVLKLRVS